MGACVEAWSGIDAEKHLRLACVAMLTAAHKSSLAASLPVSLASCPVSTPFPEHAGFKARRCSCTPHAASAVDWQKLHTQLPAPCCRPGERIALYDGRPNAEMLLSRGHIELDNPNNCLQIDAAILRADKMFMSKLEIAQAYGFSQKEQFGIYQDRMPVQLMGYLRLSRMQNAAELAAVSFARSFPPVLTTVLRLCSGRQRLPSYYECRMSFAGRCMH